MTRARALVAVSAPFVIAGGMWLQPARPPHRHARAERADAQFCAGACGRMRSEISLGRSTIAEKRTTVTRSSSDTERP